MSLTFKLALPFRFLLSESCHCLGKQPQKRGDKSALRREGFFSTISTYGSPAASRPTDRQYEVTPVLKVIESDSLRARPV